MTTKRSQKKAGKTAAKKGSARKTTKKAPSAKAAPKPSTKQTERDPRLPAVGTTLIREFKGQQIKVKVTADGFEYDGQTFKSISACARHITGYMISGPVFFKLVEPKRAEGK